MIIQYTPNTNIDTDTEQVIDANLVTASEMNEADVDTAVNTVVGRWDTDDWNTMQALMASQWKSNRVSAYNALNQFEMQFDDQLNNTTTWVDAIDAIKAEYPKL